MSRPIVRSSFLLVILLFALPGRAQFFPDPDYERVLIPVFWFGGGANGAQWWSSFEVVNTGEPFDLATAVLQGNPACPSFCGCDAKKTVEPFKSENICQQFEHSTGLLIYIPRNVDPADVHMNSRVYDRSREALRAGTQIPVVWERDLLEGPIMLLDVKTEPRYRTTLRIYDVFQWPTEFTLRFYDMARLRAGVKEVMLETRITAQHPAGPIPDNRFPQRPAYAVVGNLVLQYPQLASAESVAVEITGSHPITSPPVTTRRFYAVASITNNNTQEVTTVFP